MLFFKQQTLFLIFAYILLLCLWVPRVFAATDIAIKKSPLDKRQYKGMYLPNGLRVLLVSDPQAEKAAVSLNVAVGSFNNPADREGLAHFLEHMLFLGTKKYPQAGEYNEFINAHGGFVNAWTSNRNTQYYFNILPADLPGGLDRFSQFFIAPLFTVELVDRERHAVDSEYHLSSKKDGWRINEVNGVTANPAHPIVQFAVGSLETLGDVGKNKPVHEDLVVFYKDYYSADRMTLAIVAPQSIAQLQALVKKYFSAIPKRVVKPNNILVPAFTAQETAKQIAIQPIGDYQELSLTFPIPSQRDNYNSRSIDYILYQIKQSGPDSLYQTLRNKNWVSEISASSEDVTYNQDTAQISFSLTEDGLQHVDQIIQYTFAYLDFMRQTGPQENLFNELRLAGDRKFLYAGRMDPMDYASELSMAMQRYPLAQVLKAEIFTKDTRFDSAGINSLLKYFTPQNMRLMLIAKNVATDKVEVKYDVKYSVTDFSQTQFQAWQAPATNVEFKLPTANQFLPKDLSLRAKLAAYDKDAVPQRILQAPGVTLWYKQDQQYRLPKQNIGFLLAAPNMESTAKRALLSRFMRYAIDDKLSELATQFAIAGVSVNIGGNAQGLTLNLAMFSDQQLNVTQVILRYIQDYKIDKQRFVIYKDDIKRELLNFKQNLPVKQALLVLNDLIKTPSWLPEELLAEINTVTVKEIESYAQEFLQNVQIESLVHGNISREDAIAVAQLAARQLQVNTQRTTNLALPQLIKLPNGAKYHYDFNPEHADGVFASYYQAQGLDDKTIALNVLLAELLKIPAFDQLRTVEQLGYVVGLVVSRVREQTGVLFYVESTSKNPNYLNARWLSFLDQYKARLIKMPAPEFATHKASVRANLLEKPNSLSEETARYWNVIIDGTYRFNLQKDIAQQVTLLSKPEVIAYMQDLLLNPQTVRSVVVNSLDAKDPFVGGELIVDIAKFKG